MWCSVLKPWQNVSSCHSEICVPEAQRLHFCMQELQLPHILAGFPHNESLTTHIPGGRFTSSRGTDLSFSPSFMCCFLETFWTWTLQQIFVLCLGALRWCKKVGGCIMSQSMSFRCLVLNMLCQPGFQNVVERDYTPVRAHNRHTGRNFGKMVLRAIPTAESHVKPFLFHCQFSCWKILWTQRQCDEKLRLQTYFLAVHIGTKFMRGKSVLVLSQRNYWLVCFLTFT